LLTCCFIFSGVVRNTARLATGEAIHSKLKFSSPSPPLFFDVSLE
jgi:hypothetical protein